MTFEDVAELLRRDAESTLVRGATNEEIERAEHDLGVVFPQSYRRLLSEFGWVDVGDLELFGLGINVPVYLNVVDMTISERTEFMPLMPSNLTPILNDGFGNLYCLDTSRNDGEDCPVVFQDHESGEISDVSSSFIEWLVQELRSAIARKGEDPQ